MKLLNKFKIIVVIIYLGLIKVKYVLIIEVEIVDIVEVVNVYKCCLGMYGNCFLIEINILDCFKIVVVIVLYDFKCFILLILEIKNFKILMIKGKIFVYWRILIIVEINMIGNNILKKNGGCLGSIYWILLNIKLILFVVFNNK